MKSLFITDARVLRVLHNFLFEHPYKSYEVRTLDLSLRDLNENTSYTVDINLH